jgi:hypothetical protein
VTDEETGKLVDLWTDCSTVREFELKASALYDIDLSTRLAFRAYSFIRRHPAVVGTVVCCAGSLVVGVLVVSIAVSAAAMAFALAGVTILIGGVYGLAKACDELFTRIMSAEEASGSETPA